MRLSSVLLVGLLAQGASAFATSGPLRQHQARVQPLASSLATTVTVDISERAQRDLYPMEEWAAYYGVQKSDGFQLTSEDGRDYSVMTNTDIPAGSPVVYVPSQMLLSSWQAAQEMGPNMQEAEAQLAQGRAADEIPLFRLFVKVLAEYEKGDQSPWFAWLNSLPRRYDNGASMTYACFECLPPYVAWLSMKEKLNMANFQKAARCVRGFRKSTVSNRDLLRWAYNVAATRSYDVSGERVIAPMADMFNHGTETEVSYGFDDMGNFVVSATRDVPAGSPLRVSLGDPTNPSPLLATYGFLDESSPATFCKIMHLQTEMEQLGMDWSQLLFYKDTGDVSMEVYDLLLYSVLAFDPSLQQGFFQAYASGDADTKNQYHQQYMPYTLEALRNHVDGMLTEFDQLSAKALTRDPMKYPRVPLILKHNEFNKQTFLKVKANLDAM